MTIYTTSSGATSVRWISADELEPALARPARGRWAFRGAIAVFVALIVASYAVPLWYQVHGDRLLVVTSGSMAPEIAAGDAVVIHQVTSPSQLRVNQVITFYPLASPQLITHRVHALVNVDRLGPDGQRQFDQFGKPLTDPYVKTKGDANIGPDPDLTPVSQVRGIVREVHAGWGFPLAWAHSALGRLLLFGPPLLLLAGAEVFSRLPRDLRARGRLWGRRHDDRPPVAEPSDPTTSESDDAPALV